MTLEAAVQVLADGRVSLQKLIGQLPTETSQGFDQVAKQFAETDRRIHEMSQRTDERIRQTDERIDKLAQRSDERARQLDERMDKFAQEARERARNFDERVDKLVLGIGEFMRKSNPGSLARFVHSKKIHSFTHGATAS